MNLLALIQGLIIIIVIGMIYSLWRTTKAYGGLVGKGLRWIGLGMVFFSLEALDRVLGDLSYVKSFGFGNAEFVHNVILLLGLLFSGIGFSKLTSIGK